MSGQLRVLCPGCQTKLQVGVEMRGKQMACPKCQSRFRLPEPAAPAELPPMALPVSPEPEALSPFENLGGFPDTSAASHPGVPHYSAPQHYQAAPSGSYQTPGQYPSYQSPQTATPRSTSQRKAPREDEELSDSDSNLQSSGIFLVVVPILAALLPLFGLQLKRLASAGEYAPLAAMILGFIGSGLIVYARRNRSDAPIAGAAAVLVTLVFGVGGFLIQRGAAVDDVPVAERRPQAQQRTPEEIAAANAEFARRSQKIRDEARRNQEEFEAARKRNEANRPGFTGNLSTPDQNSSASSGNNGSILNNKPPADVMGGSSGRSLGASDRLEQDPRVMGDLMQKYSEGSSQFARTVFAGRNNLSVKNLVGTEENMGRLYADVPVVGVCGLTLARDLAIIPITFADSEVKYAVLPEGDGQLHGLRFAFEDNQIIGYQGLIQSQRTSAISETPWFGRQSADVRESLNPSPGNTGFVTYLKRGRTCGFGWIQL